VILTVASTTSSGTALIQTPTALPLIELFIGKPQASMLGFASAFRLPSNENAQHAAK